MVKYESSACNLQLNRDRAEEYLVSILRTNLGTRRQSDGITSILGRRSCLDIGHRFVEIDGA